MNALSFATQEGFDSLEARRKRMGQYFSGLRIAKLLVALAARRGMHTVCDPMAGRADMLVGARQVLSQCRRTDGVEIDPIAHGEGLIALGANAAESTYIVGSAFDARTISALDVRGYDLVVTNPPYVRYQSQKASAGATAKLPSALEVRNGLRQSLFQLATQTGDDQDDFLTLAENYSGLSDLAVPAWILCAALVKPEGTLAMVVPEAWLSRDYASIVQYLLLRWFRIEYIVEDAHAAWFSDAQVKTTLLVARRIDRLSSIYKWNEQTYLHVSLPSNIGNADSLIGRSKLGEKKQPEIVFARQARRVADGTSDTLVEGAIWQRIRLADRAMVVASSSQREPWFQQLEQLASSAPPAPYILPPALVRWFDGYTDFTTLGSLGVEIGQGLRTGANGFFYADVISRSATKSTIASNLFKGEKVAIPSACALPVVRKQADVRSTLSVDATRLIGVTLAFHGWALPEDASASAAIPLPAAAANYVRRATTVRIGEKALPSLTAVAPNVRRANPKTGMPARFWYMLPDFAPRHRPDLFIARVNSETPRVTLNPGRRALVDANFSTLWLKANAPVEPLAIFAYLNSSVAAALFEHTGAVMGGGALKLEATHLRSLPVPALTPKEWERLAGFGKILVSAAPQNRKGVVRRIDAILCRTMFGTDRSAAKVMRLHATIQSKQSARASEKP